MADSGYSKASKKGKQKEEKGKYKIIDCDYKNSNKVFGCGEI